MYLLVKVGFLLLLLLYVVPSSSLFPFLLFEQSIFFAYYIKPSILVFCFFFNFMSFLGCISKLIEPGFIVIKELQLSQLSLFLFLPFLVLLLDSPLECNGKFVYPL